MTDEPLYGTAELQQAKAYHAPYYVWECVNPVVYFAFLAMLLKWGVRPIYAWSERAAAAVGRASSGLFQLPLLRVVPHALSRLWGDASWGQALIFSLSLQGLVQLLFYPSVFYFGYVHEKAFGMWHATLERFLWESLKANVASAATLAVLTFGMYGLARRLPRWWLVAGVSASLLLGASAFLDPYRSRLTYSQTPLEQGPLRLRLEQLLVRAQVPFRDLVVEKTSELSTHVDAYFAGQGPTRTIVLDDNLLAKMSADEVEAVVAHEAGHVHQVRWPAKVASSLGVVLFLALSDAVMRKLAKRHWQGIEHRADVRTLPWLLGLFSLLGVLSSPVVGFFSRERERGADRFALALTHDPGAFRRMLYQAARLNRLDPDPPALTVWMGASHPPVGERIRSTQTVKP